MPDSSRKCFHASLHGRGASGEECALLVCRETGPFSGLGDSSVNNGFELLSPAPQLLSSSCRESCSM